MDDRYRNPVVVSASIVVVINNVCFDHRTGGLTEVSSGLEELQQNHLTGEVVKAEVSGLAPVRESEVGGDLSRIGGDAGRTD